MIGLVNFGNISMNLVFLAEISKFFGQKTLRVATQCCLARTETT